MDIDRSGKIDANEFMAALDRMGIQVQCSIMQLSIGMYIWEILLLIDEIISVQLSNRRTRTVHVSSRA